MNPMHAAALPKKASVPPKKPSAASREARRAPVDPQPWHGGPIALQRRCACGAAAGAAGECEACGARRKRPLQARRAGGPPAADADSHAMQAGMPSAVDAALRSPGRPLDAATRSFFEARFERDFGDVRLHAGDSQADAAARSVDALAFASGRHVVFASGQYRAGTRGSMRLLAHELTHVVQQRAGLATARADADASNDPAEREAERNADLLHTRQPLGFEARAPGLARAPAPTATPGPAPNGPNGCSPEHQTQITPAVARADTWLGTSIAAVDRYIAAPAAPANQAVREALDRHFKSHTVDHASVLRARLSTLRTDLRGRDPATVECHPATDAQCTGTAAYVPGNDLSRLVFCPAFFDDVELDPRARLVVHEMGHTLLGLVSLADRAYRSDRLLPHLSTEEAFDNAESHALFVQEVGTGAAMHGTAPEDDIDEDCPAATRARIEEAIARGQRWNRDASMVANNLGASMERDTATFYSNHLGDNAPATRSAAAQAFNGMDRRLRERVEVRCDARAKRQCGSRTAYSNPAKKNLGRGAGFGALAGAGAGLIAGLAAGLGGGGPGLALGLGLGLLGLGTIAGLVAGSATSHEARVHVCPGWTALPDMPARTEALLAALYETYGGLDATRAAGHAALARALHEHYIGQPPEV